MSELERFDVVGDDGESTVIILVGPDDVYAGHMGDSNKTISKNLGSYETIDGSQCSKQDDDSFLDLGTGQVYRRVNT